MNFFDVYFGLMKGGKINFLDLCREVVSSLGEKEEEEKRKRSEKSVGEVRGGNKKGKFVLRRERKDAKISRNPIQTGVRQTSLTFESTKRIRLLLVETLSPRQTVPQLKESYEVYLVKTR